MTDPLVTRYFNSFDGKNGRSIKSLPKQEELKLFRRWKKKKDKAALDKLIVANLKFVVKCANRFKSHADGKAIDINDLIQAGNEGLMHAITGFEPERDLKFITYAVHWINACIRNFIYANVSTVRVSLNNKTKALIDQKWTAFNLLNGKNSEELNEWRNAFTKKHKIPMKTMKMEEEKIQTIYSIFSMDKNRTGYDGGSTNDTTLHNELNSDQFNIEYLIENKEEQDLIKKRVREALKRIPQRDRDILRQRFGIDKQNRDIDPMTLRESGLEQGISRERIRQLEARALKLVKERLEKDQAIQEIVGIMA